MNDIEIFKKLKKNYNTLKKDYNAGHYSVYEMQFEDFEAIENLIQRNKDLEQIEKEHKKENGRLREEIDKKDKIINLMAERLAEDTEWFYSEFDNYTKQDFIEYFTNKVEEDIKE